MGIFSKLIDKFRTKPEPSNLELKLKKYGRTLDAYRIANNCRDVIDFYYAVQKDESLRRRIEIYSQRHNITYEQALTRLYKSLSDNNIQKFLCSFEEYLGWEARIEHRKEIGFYKTKKEEK